MLNSRGQGHERAWARAACAALIVLGSARVAAAQEAVWVVSAAERAQPWYPSARAALEAEGVLVSEADPAAGRCSVDAARAAASARGLSLGMCMRLRSQAAERRLVVELVRGDGTRATGSAPESRAAEAYRRAELALALGEQGLLRVRTSPAGALVSIDGEPAGHAPLERRLPAGSHGLSLALEGFSPESRSIEIEPGAALDVDVRLLPPGQSARPMRTEASPLNYILGGALVLAGGSALAIGIAAAVRDGDCAEHAVDGTCTREVSFGTRSALLVAAGAAAVVGGGLFLLLAPIEVEASADADSARIDLRARF